ncbi:MAG: excinuclease ABC subunit UvrC [Bacteroidales bacterium]|jgi:excinuclease ABC subunit C|nr:excinuclease ABC subunit UvrC [Bacteroidales bacterium]
MPTNDPHIKAILQTLPEKGGVYRYYDKNGTIIYVGKAKNLKKRVVSYFRKEQLHPRVRLLVKNVADIQYTVVDTEYDALLLENNLIKEYKPKYNVQLKDDKTYPWLCITDDCFPRLFPTRRKTEENARYFGPYASVKMMNALLETVEEIYPLRKCKLNLTEKKIHSGKFKPCLNYHIKKCHGICIGKQSAESYRESITHIINIIRGNIALVISELRSKMMIYANDTEFEKAHEVKLKIELLEKYQAKSTIVSSSINNVDVFGIIGDDTAVYVCGFKVVNGSIVQTQTVSIRQQLNETLEDILLYAVVGFRKNFNSTAREIIVPYPLDFDIDGAAVVVPEKGDKYKLLQLAYRNAMGYMHEIHKQKELSNPEQHRRELLETMQKDLQLPCPPAYIECFDNSNIQGKYPVSSMVCFRNGKPSKKEYRIFHVKSDKPDDFSTMAETIQRRYEHLREEGMPLPDLIVVDGGKGQVSAAYAVLQKMGLADKISLLGIAKRLEEIYRPNDPIPLFVDKKSETQRIIQYLRDEAHRFGIMHHRKRRDKAMKQTDLTNIQGIGENMAAKLLSVFRSVSVIKNASLEDIARVIGSARAATLYNYYHTDLSSSSARPPQDLTEKDEHS